MDGWYLGDGMLCLENEPMQYDPEYWKNVNKYRLPGTTVNDKERQAVTIAQKNEYLSSRDFVGTLSAGKTGISVMQLESFHFDGNLETQRTKTLTPYGGPLPTHECTLTANKAYFFMNGYAVCLGSGVNAHDNAKVYTVIENSHTTNTCSDKYIVSPFLGIGAFSFLCIDICTSSCHEQ